MFVSVFIYKLTLVICNFDYILDVFDDDMPDDNDAVSAVSDAMIGFKTTVSAAWIGGGLFTSKRRMFISTNMISPIS